MGAVLAGGASRRMGAPKEGVLLPDGRPMLECVLDALSAACGRVVVVGACQGFSLENRKDVDHLPDGTPGEGPLAALVTLLSSGLADGYLMAACDQPFLEPALLRRLVEGDPGRPRFFRAPDGAPLDPFPGFFPTSLLIAASTAVDSGQRSLRRFVSVTLPDWVILSAGEMAQLRDLDTPEDIAGLGMNQPRNTSSICIR